MNSEVEFLDLKTKKFYYLYGKILDHNIPIKCNLCNDLILNEICRPCSCNKFYHQKCLKIYLNNLKIPINNYKCHDCQLNFTSSIINPKCIYLINIFNYLNKYLPYTALFSYLLGLIITTTNGLSFKLSNDILFQVLIWFSFIIWLYISGIYYIFPYQGIFIPYLYSCVSFIMALTSTLYSNEIVEYIFISFQSISYLQQKKYFYIYSSRIPYLNIDNFKIINHNHQ